MFGFPVRAGTLNAVSKHCHHQATAAVKSSRGGSPKRPATRDHRESQDRYCLATYHLRVPRSSLSRPDVNGPTVPAANHCGPSGSASRQVWCVSRHPAHACRFSSILRAMPKQGDWMVRAVNSNSRATSPSQGIWNQRLTNRKGPSTFARSLAKSVCRYLEPPAVPVL